MASALKLAGSGERSSGGIADRHPKMQNPTSPMRAIATAAIEILRPMEFHGDGSLYPHPSKMYIRYWLTHALMSPSRKRGRISVTKRRAIWPPFDLVATLRVQESSFLEFLECIPELLLSVHDDRAIPRYGLLKWPARDEQKPDSLVSCLYRDLISTIKEHE
jgi:hypothetical protein